MMSIGIAYSSAIVANVCLAQCEKHAGTAFCSWQQQKCKWFGMRRFSVFGEAINRTLYLSLIHISLQVEFEGLPECLGQIPQREILLAAALQEASQVALHEARLDVSKRQATLFQTTNLGVYYPLLRQHILAQSE